MPMVRSPENPHRPGGAESNPHQTLEGGIEMLPLPRPPRTRGPLLFLFDFDDTLFPTTQLSQEYPKTPYKPGHVVPPRIDVHEVIRSMQELLGLCCELGEVRVISTAMDLWLDLALRPYLNHPRLQRVQVHSSRPYWDRGLCPSKLPLFKRFVEQTRCRKAIIVGDGPDERKSFELLRQTARVPLYFWQIPAPAPYLSATTMRKEHRRLRKEIAQLGRP